LAVFVWRTASVTILVSLLAPLNHAENKIEYREEVMTPNRRKVLSLLPAATVAGIASPAIAQTNPQIRWRLASSFPKNIDIM